MGSTSQTVRTDLRHHRVGDAGGRRQGQGPEGRRPAGDRLRRRRARLPDPRLHRRGRAARPAPSRGSTSTRPTAGLPELREAIAAKTARDSGLSRPAPARCWSPTAASRRSTRRSPPCSTRATRCCCPRRTGRPIPRSSRWRAAWPCRCRPTRPPATWPASPTSRRTAPTRTKVLLFVSPSNPTGAVYPPGLVAEIGQWAARKGLWVVTDEIYEHLVYGTREVRLDARSPCPSWPTAAWCSTGSPRPTP